MIVGRMASLLLAALATGGTVLRVSASLDRASYEVGEPIRVTVTVTNTSDRPVEGPVRFSDETGREDGYAFEVRRADGTLLTNPSLGQAGSFLGTPAVLLPAASSSRTLLLNDFVPLLSPGRYSVRTEFRPMGAPPVQAPDLALEVLPTPPERRREHVATLVEQIHRGADTVESIRLLGFTGHPDAIAPLVDFLYDHDDRLTATAAGALVYPDPAEVRDSLLRALRTRGPRPRMVYLLVVKLRSDPGDVAPLLRPWLTGPDEVTRRAAVEGLALTNVERLARQDLAPDPTLFSALATMLADSSPDVRRRAAVAVGHYADRAALAALTPLVDDDDGSVREQATIAVGWVAEKAEPGAPLRDESVALLTRLAARGEGEAARQASYWLGRVTAKR